MSWQRGGSPINDFYLQMEREYAMERWDRVMAARAEIYRKRKEEQAISVVVDQDPGDEQ